MTAEWRDPDDIAADLGSGDAVRIRAGLADLREFAKDGDEFELPALDASLLAPLGDAPPPDAVRDLAHLLARYRSFMPPPSRDDVIVQLVELAVRYAESQVIYEAAIEIQSEADPAATAHLAVGYLGARGLAGPAEFDAGRKLIGYLLEAKPAVRRAAAEALAAWPAGEARRAVVTAVHTLIDPDQRAQITPDGPPLTS